MPVEPAGLPRSDLPDSMLKQSTEFALMCDPTRAAGSAQVVRLSRSRLCGTARNVTDPKPWLEATALVEAMHARVLATTLKQHVVTVLGPSCRERSLYNRTPMALAPEFGMSDDIFEETVPTSCTQQIWRSAEHTGCNDPDVRGGYEDRNAFVRQHFQPDFLGSLARLRTGAYFCDSIELEQRSEVGSFSKPGIGHLDIEL